MTMRVDVLNLMADRKWRICHAMRAALGFDKGSKEYSNLTQVVHRLAEGGLLKKKRDIHRSPEGGWSYVYKITPKGAQALAKELQPKLSYNERRRIRRAAEREANKGNATAPAAATADKPQKKRGKYTPREEPIPMPTIEGARVIHFDRAPNPEQNTFAYRAQKTIAQFAIGFGVSTAYIAQQHSVGAI